MKTNKNFLPVSGFVICIIMMTACSSLPLTSTIVNQEADRYKSDEIALAKRDLAEILKTTLVYKKDNSSYSWYSGDASVSDEGFVVTHRNKKVAVNFQDLEDVNLLDWSKNNVMATSGHYRFCVELQNFYYSWNQLNDAQKFIDALSFLRKSYIKGKEKASFESFEPIAAQYRALKVKPPVSEVQRKYIVQANVLTQQKKYKEAIDLYDKAIEYDPTNPIIYYNQALLFAQIRRFDDAINRMKKYLLLAPDASDARSAQDKIYEWEITGNKKTNQ